MSAGKGDAAIELPDLHAGELDAETLESLFADLRRFADVREVRLKGDAARRADAAPSSLDEALDALRTRRAHGAQIVYEHDGRTWCDTVLAAASGWKLLRMESPRRGELV